jgi:branched-chain amino acid transport system ATP-binding protein
MSAVLAIEGLQAWYGESHILHGVSCTLEAGQVMSILGRNGSGRSTLMRAIMGLTSRRQGSIRIFGQETIQYSTHQMAPLGLAWCPEERAIFASLTVHENLLLPPRIGDGGFSLDDIYHLFPALKERARSRGTSLSGGEQQMLALARILRTGARLLLLDEITEGLAPVIVEKLEEVVKLLKSRGYTILLAEQNFSLATAVADVIALMEHGVLTHTIPSERLSTERPFLESRLGV